ncbi:MAG: NAD(P)/FAD-dependent oxidoreductase [Acidimicrobiales bacterium]
MTINEAGQTDAAAWAEAVEIANIPTLLMVLVQLTGDLRWLNDPYRPSRTRGLGDNDTGGLPEILQREIRAAALDAILAWRGGRPLAIPVPDDALLVEMMSVSLGEDVDAEYATMIAEELGMRPPRSGPVKAPPYGFHALIVGAGVSGMCAAIRLREAGIDYEIVERHETVGGTWLENHYPGCGVDTPSHLYSFSFAPHDWSHYFSLRDDLHAYLEKVADDFEVRPHITFNTEVLGAVYDEEAAEWIVETRRGEVIETKRANILISAVGAFNKPKMPKVAGAETFEGPSAHTARWPEAGIDLAGKRVAVIGTGASAMQLVPAIVDEAQSVTVFQRSPQWAAPFEKFKESVPDPIRFLLMSFPLYRAWYRLRLSWAFNDKVYPALQKDPTWPHPERSVNEINDGHRRYFTRYIVEELGERQDLLEKVLPSYPPFGKRMLLDNGWFRTMTRPTVDLVTEGVVEIRPRSVVAASGEEYEADVLVWATGFDVVQFLVPMRIVGRNGTVLEEVWGGDDARAYLGAAMPGFPNFFCLYGPNTQFGHGGSLITVMERQIHYMMSLLEEMFEAGVSVVEVRQDVHDRYNEAIDRAHANMVWTHEGMDTYYRNSKGRVVVNNPFRIVDYWKMTAGADLDDFVTEPARSASPVRAGSTP